jgi:hypothetical protein
LDAITGSDGAHRELRFLNEKWPPKQLTKITPGRANAPKSDGNAIAAHGCPSILTERANAKCAAAWQICMRRYGGHVVSRLENGSFASRSTLLEYTCRKAATR